MTKYCSSCGKEIAESTKFCQSCGKPSEMPSPVQPQAIPPQVPVQNKNPGVAAVLSFVISGTGQIYNGELGKGIAVFVIVVASFLIGMALTAVGNEAGKTIGVLLTLISIVIWIWAIYDAYTTAKKINQGDLKL